MDFPEQADQILHDMAIIEGLMMLTIDRERSALLIIDFSSA